MMKRVLHLCSALSVIVFASVLYSSVTEDTLLWDTFAESEQYYQTISDYSCTVKTITELPEAGAQPSLLPIRLIYQKPDHYYFVFTDEQSNEQEFIFIEGDTHRQFMYPKQYQTIGSGEFLYRNTAVSIPQTSLDFYYKQLIPFCQKHKDDLSWEMTGTDTYSDSKTISFTITFTEPLEFLDMPASRIELTVVAQDSIPLRIAVYDAQGTQLELLQYIDLNINQGLNPSFFKDKMDEKRGDRDIAITEMLTLDEARATDPTFLKKFVLDLVRLGLDRYSRIEDYQTHFTRQELLNDKLQPEEEFLVKFRKPFDLYMKWTAGPNKGWELLYARGRYNNKVIVHVTGLANFFLPTLELDPTGGLVMLNNRHSILEFGIGYIMEQYYRDIKTSLRENELILRYNGNELVDGRICWVFEAILPPDSNYYCTRSIMYFDQEYLLPTKTIFYDTIDGKEIMIEKYIFADLSFNNGFNDTDFDKTNKEYHF